MTPFGWGLALGVVAGVALAVFFKIAQLRTSKQLADELFEKMMGNVKSEFGSLSLDALSKSSQQFLTLADSKFQSERALTGQELENKKKLIDQQLAGMNVELGKVSGLISQLEKDRADKFGQLTSALKSTNEQTASLLQTTNTLKEALANSRARGQWGERMAEDVLRLAGFIEGVNYLKQKAIEGIGSKPDITFLLPKSSRLNMDVKFPYDNYVRFLSSKTDEERDRFKADFFRDVKAKVKEVTSREYINPETVDYVILFVPNEQIFSFIQEEDSSIFDAGLKSKVVFCSPITLFAVLAIIRQAVDNFSLEQTSHEILSLLGNFKTQWLKFMMKLETVGKRIDDAQKEYQALTTTRRTQLERPLNKIEALRAQKGIPIADETLVSDELIAEETSAQIVSSALHKNSDLLQ